MNSITEFFQELSYGQYLLTQILNSRFIKNKLTDILMVITANIIEMQTVSLMCYFVTTNTHLDLIIPVVISVIMAININHFYKIIEPFRPQFYLISRYLIHNYTVENYIYWKRLFVTCITFYALILLTLINIDNTFILIYLGQTFAGFLVLDQYEQRYFHNIIKNYRERPKTIVHANIPFDTDLVKSYFPNKSMSNNNTPPKVIWLKNDEDEERRENMNHILNNSLRRNCLSKSFIENRQSRSCSF